MKLDDRIGSLAAPATRQVEPNETGNSLVSASCPLLNVLFVRDFQRSWQKREKGGSVGRMGEVP